MRTAELLTAIILGAVSIGFMVSAYQLPIGYIADEGPGAGAFPFWLGVLMLVTCVWTFVRALRGTTPPSRSAEPFLTRDAMVMFALVAGSLGTMILLVHFIGIYGAVPLFLLFYLRVIGNHGWPLTLLLAILIPVVTFLFFEVALTITLPKGYTEPWFYPLYDFFL